MANVRLLRQLVNDYNDRINRANEDYAKEWGIYEKAVDAYNAQIKDAQSGTKYVGQTSEGWGLFGGVDAAGNLAYQKSLNILNEVPSGGYVSYTEQGAEYPTKLEYVKSGDKVVEYAPTLGGQVENSGGVLVDSGRYEFQPTGVTYSYLPTKTPVEPTTPEVKPLNLTEKEKGLLSNPTLGPSELNMAQAWGNVGKSTLAGDEAPAARSAFADPEDPNNLKDRGILARVLGGQL